MRSWPGDIWMERHQITLYLAAIFFGCLFGLWLPAGKTALEITINPLIGLLLYATFLALPLGKLGEAFKDLKFVGALVLVNFLLVPLVVFGLTRFVQYDHALLVGVLLVLLAPCVDYVIVFTNVAGGAGHRLLAATPMLMILQMVLIPAFIFLVMGPQAVELFAPEQFLRAFLGLIVLPLVAATLTRFLAQRSPRVGTVNSAAQWLMVPLMMATLAAVVGSQIVLVTSELHQVLRVLPIFVAFAVIMAAVGTIVAKLSNSDVAAGRALVFSGITRNSLVVLPLALALPAEYDLAPTVVVTQTLVELLCMLILIRLVPKILRARKPARN
ncbi:arsenic resistance protein [Glutamicibacter arilaitensis]|uniref:arsenic resistance protein n=1 Tax=Glutamicibacter arilaitensis TaxID=256701 RepID=UPI00384B6485